MSTVRIKFDSTPEGGYRVEVDAAECGFDPWKQAMVEAGLLWETTKLLRNLALAQSPTESRGDGEGQGPIPPAAPGLPSKELG